MPRSARSRGAWIELKLILELFHASANRSQLTFMLNENSCHRSRSIKFPVENSFSFQHIRSPTLIQLSRVDLSSSEKSTAAGGTWNVRHDVLCQPLIVVRVNFIQSTLPNRHFINNLSAAARRKHFALSSWCSCIRDKYWNCKNIYCESFRLLCFVFKVYRQPFIAGAHFASTSIRINQRITPQRISQT